MSRDHCTGRSGDAAGRRRGLGLPGWKVNGWRLGEGIAQGQIEAVTLVCVVERQQQSVSGAEGQKDHDQLEELQRRAATATATADGLRKPASSLATQIATCNAETAGDHTTRERTAVVLAGWSHKVAGWRRG